MPVFYHLYCLGWYLLALLLAFSGVAVATTTHLPGTAEVDLIFPRNNGVYASANTMPVIFAIQNPILASLVKPYLYYTITNARTSKWTRGQDTLWFLNTTTEDPYFAYSTLPLSGINLVVEEEGSWQFEWRLSWTNCTEENQPLPGTYHIFRTVNFTTKDGAPEPDFVAATGDGTCAKTWGFTFNITGTQKADRPLKNLFPEISTCAVTSTTTPAPDPCRVKLNSTAASSISQKLSACYAPTTDVGSCEPTGGAGALQQFPVAGGGSGAWLVAAISASLGWIFA